jgi:ParB-like chromosome segregation protein Spo0J
MAIQLQSIQCEGRGDIYYINPGHLTRVTDPDHPKFDSRVKIGVNEGMARSIADLGVLEPILVQKGPEIRSGVFSVYVIDGNQRTINAIEANRIRAERGDEPILVPVIFRRGDGDGDVALVRMAANMHIQESPISTALKVRAALNAGKTETQVANALGLTPAKVNALLSLLELDPSAQEAIDTFQAPLAVAPELVKLPQDQQMAALAPVLEAAKEGQTVTPTAAKQAVRKATGKTRAKMTRMTMPEIRGMLDGMVAEYQADRGLGRSPVFRGKVELLAKIFGEDVEALLKGE